MRPARQARFLRFAFLCTVLLAARAWPNRPASLSVLGLQRTTVSCINPVKGFSGTRPLSMPTTSTARLQMYGGDKVWLATSQDGVHWKDYGVVIKSEGFKNNAVWKQYVTKVGDRYIMNHGAFADKGTSNNLLRFYESTDLIQWKYSYEFN